MSAPGDSNDTSIFDRLTAWEEQKRRESAEFEEAIAAEEVAALEKLAKIRKARELLAPPAAPPASVPEPPPPPVVQAEVTGDLFSASRKRELRKANLHVIIDAVLAKRSGLTFRELFSLIEEIKQDVQAATVHSALGRLRDKSVRFDGTRGGMTYHLIAEADAGRIQTSGAAHHQRPMDATAEHILRLLREQPRRPIKGIAAIIYGDDGEKPQNNIRSNLSKLSKMTPPRVANVGRGQWEAIDSE